VISCIIEILTEPLYIIALNLHFYGFRTKVEGISLIFKVFYIFLNLNFYNNSNNNDTIIIIFGFGQIIEKIIIFYSYYFYFLLNNNNIKIFPNLFNNNNNSNNDNNSNNNNDIILLIKNIISFWIQSFLKFILSEGEKITLLYFSFTLNDQGVYDVTTNLGSLIVRIIFQPIEEITNIIWSKLLNKKKLNENDLRLSKIIFKIILKFLIILGILF
jgi:oligosaccharide translocation protein RFT1